MTRDRRERLLPSRAMGHWRTFPMPSRVLLCACASRVAVGPGVPEDCVTPPPVHRGLEDWRKTRLMHPCTEGWWRAPLIPALGRLRLEDCLEFEVSLD